MDVILRESRTASPDADLMGARGLYHEGRVAELVKKFKIWREERLPGVRAFQSTYDRYALSFYVVLARADCSWFSVGTMVCRWLFQVIHDTDASVAFDYILPLMVCFFYHWFVRPS